MSASRPTAWIVLMLLSGVSGSGGAADAAGHSGGDGGSGCGLMTEWAASNGQGGFHKAHTGSQWQSGATTGWTNVGHVENRNRPGEIILYEGWPDDYPSHGFCT